MKRELRTEPGGGEGAATRRRGKQKEEVARMEAEDALRCFGALLDAASDMILFVDPASLRILAANRTTTRMLGHTHEALLTMKVHDVSPQFGESMRVRRIGEQLQSVGHVTFESAFKRKDGTSFSVESSLSFVHLENPWVLAIVRDVSERKAAEAVLRTSEAKLSNALKLAHLSYWEYDVARDLFTFNDQFFAMMHTTAEAAGGYTMTSEAYAQRFMHPDDRTIVRTGVLKALDNPDPHSGSQLEHRVIYADGGIGHITVRIFVVKDERGQTVRSYGVNQDITDRKQNEEALRESQERFSRLAQAAFEGIAVIAERQIVDANDQLAEMLQTMRSDLIGKDIAHFLTPGSAESAVNHLRCGTDGPVEFQALRRDGSVFPIEARTRLMRANGGSLRVTTVHDITERKEAEQQLISSQQEKEVLLKEIHHRVKNNMQVISSMLSLASERTDDSTAKEVLRESMNRIHSMALVHEGLYRSKDFADIDFNEYLRKLTTLLHRNSGKLQVICSVGGDNVHLPIHTALPCGLIANELVSNALKHAFPGHRAGTITITLRQEEVGRVSMAVRDDGVGFPPGMDIEAVSSMGMTIVHALVDQIAGSITIEGRNGTTVVVSVPAT